MCAAFWHVQRAACYILQKKDNVRALSSILNAAICDRTAQRRTFLSSTFKLGKDSTYTPRYPRHPYTIKLGSIDVVDDFRWLCDYEAAKPYLQQEQQYYETFSRRWSQQAGQLLQEMRQHVCAAQQEDPPEQVGPYVYYTVSNPHGQDTVLRQGAAGGWLEEVVVSAASLQQDAEVLAGQYDVHVLGEKLMALKLSQDQQLLAYSVDVAEGSEEACCIGKDLKTGRLLADCILQNVTSFEWSADGSCLYYCRPDELGRPSKVYRHIVGQHQGSDVLLFSDEDPKHFVTLTHTKDWRYVLINTHSKLSSEVHMLDAHDQLASSICLQPRTPGLEYFVEHHHGYLLLLTNKPPPTHTQQGSAAAVCTAAAANGVPGAAGPTTNSTQAAACTHAAGGEAPRYSAAAAAAASGDYCLAAVPAAEAAAGRGGVEAWQLLVPERPGVAVTDMDLFDSCVVLHELHNGRPGLNIVRLAQQQQQEGGVQLPQLTVLQQQQVRMPDWVFALRPGINQDYNSSSMRVYASSPAAPEQALQLNLNTGQIQHYQQQQQQQQQVARRPQPQQDQQTPDSMSQPSSPQQLVCKQLWAPAADGTQLPITLLHQRGQPYNGQQPLLVEVYGAYGQVLAADHRPHRQALLQRGWSVALAHVRGGGELGRRWHAAGRQLQKPNSVSDLLACLQLLVDMKVTSPGKIAGHAASAGGLTMAAAVNTAPDWFMSVVLEVPFVDWVGGMGDVGLEHLLTDHEAEEWGDPEQPAIAQMIHSMCPYSNVNESMQYPPMLVTAGLLDTRVPFWMPVKYVAKLRSAGLSTAADQSGRGLVLLQFAEDAGHFSMGELGGSLEDVAAQYAFMLYCHQKVEK